MRTGTIRLVDVAQFLVWLLQGREKNALDLDILDYPTLRVYTAEADRKVGYLPVHGSVILESLALNPEASAREKLEAVCAMTQHIERDALAAGVRELFYISSDDRTDESAVRQLGFEKVAAYRKKLK